MASVPIRRPDGEIVMKVRVPPQGKAARDILETLKNGGVAGYLRVNENALTADDVVFPGDVLFLVPPQSDIARVAEPQAANQMVTLQQASLAASLRVVDVSRLMVWLPPIDSKVSLGRVGSTRVDRDQLDRIEAYDVISFPELPFSRLFEEKKEDFLRALRLAGALEQRVTDEMDGTVKKDCYRRQLLFIVTFARAIAEARKVPVTIHVTSWDGEPRITLGQYYRKPDGYFRIGGRPNVLEQKTEEPDERSRMTKLDEARGQVVVLGNQLYLDRSKYHGLVGKSRVIGFVGTGLRVQCIQQVDEYDNRPRAVDCPLLPLAEGDYTSGQYFTVNMNSLCVKWIGAVLDREILEEAQMTAAGEVSPDAFQDKAGLKLRSIRGYAMGDQFLEIPMQCEVVESGGELNVLATGVALNTEMALVLRVVLPSGEVWWLKFGPEVTHRQAALQGSEEEGGWERWFQTERDMFFRAQLGGMDAFPVSVMDPRSLGNRPAMLVKDAGESLEQLLFTSPMTSAQVYEMSRQLFHLLQRCASKGVHHGDVSLQNICYKAGTYSLIDWGLACGRRFPEFIQAVDRAWPSLGVKSTMPGIPNWELSPNCYFLGMRPQGGSCDLESLLYCCLKILSGNSLPWSQAAESGTEVAVLHLRREHLPALVAKNKAHLYEPLLEQLNWSLITGSNARTPLLVTPFTDGSKVLPASGFSHAAGCSQL